MEYQFNFLNSFSWTVSKLIVFCQSYILVIFVDTVPLDRDSKNNKTDTFANLENIKLNVGGAYLSSLE